MKTKWTYDAWIGRQVATILCQIKPLSLAGRYDAAVYAFPAANGEEGYLSVCEEQPEGACDVVRFPGVSDRIMAVSCTQLPHLLWEACRRFPIVPAD